MDNARPTRTELTRPRNLILAQMPEEQYRALFRHLVPVELPVGMQLSTPNEHVPHVFFPLSGLISVGAMTNLGECVEVCVIGREGLAGLCGLLGHQQMGHSVIVQGPGQGLRIRMSHIREEFVKGGAFAADVHKFAYLQMLQMAQSVLCNRLHAVEARLARWLLTAADRTQTEMLTVTQESLAQMMGSRRSTVTVTAGELQRLKLIDYKRGRVTIVDRPGLEAKACECYSIVRTKYEELIGRDY